MNGQYDQVTVVDPLDEASADLLVEKALENNIKSDIENGLFSGAEHDASANRGGARHKMSNVRRGVSDEKPIYQPPPYSAKRNFEQLEDHIRHALPFKGKYATVVDNGRLMIPSDYHPLLEYGGVVTYGNDEHLLLFGRTHWARMEQLLLRDLGIQADRDRLVRHFYRGKMDFDHLNEDGSITLSKSLMKFAGIKDKAVLIGVVYFAEIHNPDNWTDGKLDGRDVAKLSNALK